MTQELETYIETKTISWRSPLHFTSKNTFKMYAKCAIKTVSKIPKDIKKISNYFL
jgi:hypothetical protein